MARQAVPLQPIKVHGGADIQLQPMELELEYMGNHRQKLFYQSLLQAVLKTWWESHLLSRRHPEPVAGLLCLFVGGSQPSDGLSSSDFSCRPKEAFQAIEKTIVENKNFHEVILALMVPETCVKNCGHRFHVLVSSQDFVEGVLVRTILLKNNSPAIVHDKLLTLIQSWADAFRSSPDLTDVVAFYQDLRRKGLEFPMTDLDVLSLTPQRTVYTSNSQSEQNSPAVNSPQQMESILHPVTLPAQRDTSSDTPITPMPEQIGKLRSELEVVNGNTMVMSKVLTELLPSQAEPSDLELLQELNRTCRPAMQQHVLELILHVLHEQLTEELLLINDNLNNVFLHYERYLSPPFSTLLFHKSLLPLEGLLSHLFDLPESIMLKMYQPASSIFANKSSSQVLVIYSCPFKPAV
ncbi:LOW QUALITY PROTEIN: target of Myb1 membrane trafficking protein-like [Cuculus canorus]|uniref:LOW QUALITY PROTEIN: target of Myb1 membrane trafficking protein-like n=1 Tax=Cuculus canorus TaxID=55661 RepID=UPI0023AA6F01|nr:LOW QUALITY PROTEIN: target of Myb1 membrane trafficking protein-like [Cuculus canorus]